LHEKSLTEANMIFFEKHEGNLSPHVAHLCNYICIELTCWLFFVPADSLIHRAAVAEMLSVLEPNKKLEAVKLIEDSTNNPAPM